tara:strand:+ start:128 stop:1624 length:1497 start_codon:yes stop_codon:yes gene_type:complete
MAKRKEFTITEISQMISMYENDMLGTPTIGVEFGVDKGVINRTLKAHGVILGKSGMKYRGGKTEADKRYYNKNKDIISEYHAEWRNNNKEKLKEYHAEWRSDNQDKVKSYASNYHDKVQSDPKLRLVRNTRTALWSALTERNISKNKRTFDILGYSVDDLVIHLQSLFTDGMSWDNYGEWHVDHIIPISEFDYDSINDYEFAKCWELTNLRPMWSTTREIGGQLYEGNLNKNSKLPSTCYQYRVRELKRAEEEGGLSFDPSECSISNSEVRAITKVEAKKIIEEYEWLGYMPSYTKYHFGIFFNIGGREYLGGVVVFQDDYVENVGGWDKYGYSGKIILLSRGVCLWWAPKNANTYLISKALKWLETNTDYKVVTATVDSLAGEIGTIYQAANWNYVGVMDGNILKNGKARERLGVLIDNKLYTSRQIRSMLGTMKKGVILENYPEAKFIKQKAKSRYFYFLGSKKERKLNRLTISSQIKPYPKRIKDSTEQSELMVL